jgi:hypothetical protein
VGVEHLMNTRPVTVAVVGAVASLVLGGCGAGGASPDAASPGTASSDASGPGTASPGAATASPSPGKRAKDGGEDRTARPGEQSGDQADGAEDAPAASPSTPPDTDSDAATDSEGTADGSAPALEMPEAPEPTVDSLSELLPPSDPGPLVTTPLPRAATAQGRLLRRFPDALRPTRAARVQSSSVSPSGDRLQVGLVATSSLSPGQVLLAYRTRLARRGMAETATPPSVAGSTAAAFRRGDSVVTVTVTARGSGTTYAVHASLRAERG